MEEILASIRRIIADDETKPTTDGSAGTNSTNEQVAARTAAPVARPPAKGGPGRARASVVEPPAAPQTNSQDDIDALMAGPEFSANDVATPAAASDSSVLELTDEMALPDLSEPELPDAEPANDLEFAEVAVPGNRPRAPGRRSPEERASPLEVLASPVPQMLSRSTAAAVESAFNALASTVLSNNARTLEDLVREMLRPMLKSWLDDNLPSLVERIVKAEIERVSRGR